MRTAGKRPRLRAPAFLQDFLRLKRNARVCIGAEPFNTVPYNLYKPYFSRYMQALGITKLQIGWIGSINMLMHMLAALLSTVVIDRLGRKRTTVLIDLIGWVIPCIIWAVGQSYASFVAGTVLGAFWRISNSSWTCLFVEEAEPQELLPIFSWINIVGQIASFVTPVAGVIVGWLGLVSGMRVLLWISFAMMLTRVLLLAFGCRETEEGKRRMAQTRGEGIGKALSETLSALRIMLKSPGILITTLLVLLVYANKLLYDTYFPLLIVEQIGLPDASIGFFTVARSACALLLASLLTRRLQLSRHGTSALLAGLLVGVLCYVGMTLLPQGSYVGVALSFILQGVLLAILDPLVNSLLAVHVPAPERARIVGLVWMSVHALCIPLTSLLGVLSQADLRFPFYLTALLFVIGAAAVLLFRRSLSAPESSIDEST